MHFIQLLAADFCRDTLVRLWKAVMDNTNGRPSDSHHNHAILVLERVWLFHYDQATELIIYNCHKGSISHYKSLFDQEKYHSSSEETTLNTLQNVELKSVFFKQPNTLMQLEKRRSSVSMQTINMKKAG